MTCVDLGLQILHFLYHALLALFMVSSRQLRTQSASPARQLLRLLPSLGNQVLSLKGPYNCLLWQLLKFPMAAFGSLWGAIIVNSKTSFEQSKESLEAIRHLPPFFGKLSTRNSLAARLESITERIVQHANIMLYSQGECLPRSCDRCA